MNSLIELKPLHDPSTKTEQFMLQMALFYVTCPPGMIEWEANVMGNAMVRMQRYVQLTRQTEVWRDLLLSRLARLNRSEMTRIWPVV